MKNYEFQLPLPPSDNALYSNNPRSGRGRFPTAECKRFKKEVAQILMVKKIPKGQDRKEWGLRVEVFMDPRRYMVRDLSNCFKAMIDAISTHIGSDDRFLVQLESVKTPYSRSFVEVSLFIGEERYRNDKTKSNSAEAESAGLRGERPVR